MASIDSSGDGDARAEPTAADLLELDIDLRIGGELWIEALGVGDWNDEQLGAFLRFAYGRGYQDALCESQRGKLCRDHGFAIPRRRPAR